MGLFNRKKPTVAIGKRNLFDCSASIRKENWFEVFSASLGKIAANQQACAELVIKGRDWNVDFSAGTIAFGKDKYPLQFIGSESSASNSWLWGWENVNQLPDGILALAAQMQKAGEAWGLDVLTTPKFELTDTFNGHMLSIITCALADKNICYYRGPHANGTILVAFSDVPDAVFAPVDVHRFIEITMESIQSFRVDHKIFVESFLYQNGVSYDWENQSIVAHFAQTLRIDFEQVEDMLRISNIKTI